jgi:hypothetical protein
VSGQNHEAQLLGLARPSSRGGSSWCLRVADSTTRPLVLDWRFKSARSRHSSAVKLFVQLGNQSKELVLCSLQVSQQSMTPFGVVLPALHIDKQSVVSPIHSVFGFLYFCWPRHERILARPLKSEGARAARFLAHVVHVCKKFVSDFGGNLVRTFAYVVTPIFG